MANAINRETMPLLGELTINQFIKCIDVERSEPNITDRNISLLSIVFGKPEAYYEALKIKDLLAQAARLPKFSLDGLQFKINKHLVINGRIYRATSDLTNMGSDRYRDIKGYLERGFEDNLHNLCASIYIRQPLFRSAKPYNPKWHKKAAKDFQKAKLKDIAGLVFFYSAVLEKSMEVIQIYLEQNLSIIMETMEQAKKELAAS